MFVIWLLSDVYLEGRGKGHGWYCCDTLVPTRKNLVERVNKKMPVKKISYADQKLTHVGMSMCIPRLAFTNPLRIFFSP